VFDISRFEKAIGEIKTNASDEEILSFIEIDKVVEKLNFKKIDFKEVVEGYTHTLGKFAFEVLWPPEEYSNCLTSPEVLRNVILKRNTPEKWIHDSIERVMRKEQEGKKLKKEIKRDHLKKAINEATKELEERKNVKGTKEREWPTNHFANNLSTVVRVKILDDALNTKILLTGDLEDWGPLLLRQGEKVKANILKVPHHGSKGVSFKTDMFCFPIFAKEAGDLIDLIDFIDPVFSLVFPLVKARKTPLPNSELEHGVKCGRILSNRKFNNILELNDKNTSKKVTTIEINNSTYNVK
ncbi:hypothetical protein AC739_19140, partial [Planococcus glaciei]|uniref:hypothetical protein n=1 Tax=Planococcus glaciei TaxID=459472 RepID=UPI0006C56B94